MYIEVKDLPECIQSALHEVKYGRKDISVSAVETVSMAGDGGDGSRRFVIMVNPDTGERKTLWGSWGGANMFNKQNAVDLDSETRPMPVGAIVISGCISGKPTYATIEVHPDRLTKMLPSGEAQTLTEGEKSALLTYRSLKSGAYRKEALERIDGIKSIVEGLVRRGLLKQSRNGATTITTAGRNAIVAVRGY